MLSRENSRVITVWVNVWCLNCLLSFQAIRKSEDTSHEGLGLVRRVSWFRSMRGTFGTTKRILGVRTLQRGWGIHCVEHEHPAREPHEDDVDLWEEDWGAWREILDASLRYGNCSHLFHGVQGHAVTRIVLGMSADSNHHEPRDKFKVDEKRSSQN